MKLSDLKNVRVDRMSREQIEDAYEFLKRNFIKSYRAFERNNLMPVTMERAIEDIQQIPRMADEYSQKVSEVAIMRKFFFTVKPGDVGESRAMSSTVAGYKSVLKTTGRSLGIKNYATNAWSERQRKDLWEKIDRVRELGPDRFLPNGFGNTLYQSGRNLKTITLLIQDMNMEDPVQILESLDARIQSVELGNEMSDREFFGL